MSILQLLTSIWLVAIASFMIIYFGYFILVILLARVRRRRICKADDFTPFISILVPCYNVSSVIGHKINETLGVDYPQEKFEIIVVESGSTDNTYGILSRFAEQGKVKLVRQRQRLGKASAINSGLSLCKSDIVVMTDADAFLQKEAIRELVGNFADNTVGAVVGNVTLASGKSIASKMNHAYYRIFRQKLREEESRFDSASFWSGELCAFRKSILERLDEDIINDDRYILLKIRSKGYRCISEPLSHVCERDAENIMGQIDHKRRTTAGTIQGTLRFRRMFLNPKYGLFGMLIFPAHFFRVILLPILLLITEILTPFVVFSLFLSAGMIWLIVMLTLAATILVMLSLFDKGRKLLFSLIYGFVVQAAIVGGIVDYVLKRQSVLWKTIGKGR